MGTTAIEILQAIECSMQDGPKTKKNWPWERKAKPEVEVTDELVLSLSECDAAWILPRIYPLLWAGAASRYPALAQVFMQHATALPIDAWLHVDDVVRADYRYCYTKPHDALLADMGAHAAAALAALSHPSGHIREKAVPHAKQLPALLRSCLLLIRVNDWSQQVSKRAALHVMPALCELNAHERMLALPSVHRLLACWRHKEHAAIEVWMECLTNSFDDAAWIAAWSGCSGRKKRVYLDALKGRGNMPSEVIRHALMRSNDRAALMWFVRVVLPALDALDRQKYEAALDHARSVPVRREWLQYLVDTDPQKVIPKLKVALLDRSRSLRQFARFYLQRYEATDFQRYYAAKLEAEPDHEIALLGLAEVSPALAHEAALLRLDSPNHRVRKAALLSLKEDALIDLVGYLLEQAVSGLPGVAKAARLRLGEMKAGLGVVVLALRKEGWVAQPALLTFLLALSLSFQKWDALEFIMLHAGDEEQRLPVERALREWRQKENRSFVSLSAARKTKLLMRLEQSGFSAYIKESLKWNLERA